MKDGSHLYDVEHRQTHVARPGFRINELRLSAKQQVPWHYHSAVQDTFYVLEGSIRIFMQDPKENLTLVPGETYAVAPKRPHLVTNAGKAPATFLVLQGIGEYDFVPLTKKGGA
jgi:quercetin dioxygenase-like cupin family protein